MTTTNENSPEINTPPNAVLVEERNNYVYFWLPLVSIVILLTVFAFWLLIPGVRIYPPENFTYELSEEELLEIANEENASLLEQTARLESAIEEAVCTDDGTLILPDSRTPFGLLPRSESITANEPQQSTPDSILQAPPSRYVVNPDSSPQSNITEPISLVNLIERTTVFVLNPAALSRGSGFFVSPELIVTNQHVIDGNDGNLFIIGPGFDHVKLAEVVAVASPTVSEDDFALLRIPNWNNPFLTLRNSIDSIQLSNVLAAGFPGDMTEYDIAFDRLVEGDLTASPSVVITDGTVNAVTQVEGGEKLIMHSASISFGNSGGPLLDTCGNLLGVNTFVQSGVIRSINFALPTERLLRFLSSKGVNVNTTNENCVPSLGN